MSIEDPGCLTSAGILSTNYETPVIKGPGMKPSFDSARRQVCAAPEDPGCLQHLNIAIEIEPAASVVTPFTPARTLDVSTYEWGMQELARAEEATRDMHIQPKEQERTLALL